MNIAIVGTGYVGLVTGACFAEMGNTVICVDNDKKKVEDLRKGIMPIYEPGLEELVKKNKKTRRLSFTTSIAKAVKSSEVVFIAVGTPSRDDGEADLTAVETVARNIAQAMDDYTLIVEKSTVPVETGKKVSHTIELYNKKNIEFDVASNPEFLREGSAVKDFLHPDRVVFGVESAKAQKILTALYKPLKAPILVTNIASAELIKHASNSFLAMKISFINAVGQICTRVGADILKVAEGVGLDDRIGKRFLSAGIGFGGPCLHKDLEAFIKIAQEVGYDFGMLKETVRVNECQAAHLVKKMKDILWILKGKTIGVLGLAFKPNTDDMRSAPSIRIIEMLQEEGALVRAYDPQATKKARKLLKGVTFSTSPYNALKKSDCMLLLTEWDEFAELDFKKIHASMNHPLIFDGRNMFDSMKMEQMGFQYSGVGR